MEVDSFPLSSEGFAAFLRPYSPLLRSPLPTSHKDPPASATSTKRIAGSVPLFTMSSFYDVIQRCNKLDEGQLGAMWEFRILDNSCPVGYMLPEHANAMCWDDTSFKVSRKERRIHLDPVMRPGDDVVEVCRREFVSLCEKNADRFNGCFQKWLRQRSDFHPIRGLDAKLAGLVIASPARGIFGIVTTGVHLNMFTVKKGKIHVWVSKRAQRVTYAGKLDQVVAGAMDPEDDMDPIATLRREALEEAGLRIDAGGAVFSTCPASSHGKRIGRVTAGTRISFYDHKDHVAGSEAGHVEPGVRYTYDLEVDAAFVPTPQEPDAIAGFLLKPVEEVKRDLRNAEWKPNCGLVMLDFLLRKGEVSAAEGEKLEMLRGGLQRELPFENV